MTGKSGNVIPINGSVQIPDELQEQLNEASLPGKIVDLVKTMYGRQRALEIENKRLKTRIESAKKDGQDNLELAQMYCDDSEGLKDKLAELEIALEASNKKSGKDFLTGLRKKDDNVYDEIKYAIEKCRQENLPFAMIMMDLDLFKQYNDKYGHIQGDSALRTVGEILTAQSRAYDLVVRYGGEEFLAFMPYVDVNDAKKYASRVSATINAKDVPLTSDKLPKDAQNITISIGIAYFDPKNYASLLPSGSIDNSTIEKLLNKADTALYHRKRNSRNGFTVYDESMEK